MGGGTILPKLGTFLTRNWAFLSVRKPTHQYIKKRPCDQLHHAQCVLMVKEKYGFENQWKLQGILGVNSKHVFCLKTWKQLKCGLMMMVSFAVQQAKNRIVYINFRNFVILKKVENSLPVADGCRDGVDMVCRIVFLFFDKFWINQFYEWFWSNQLMKERIKRSQLHKRNHAQT